MITQLKRLGQRAALAALAGLLTWAIIGANAVGSRPGNEATAPEFSAIEKWLNSGPLTMRQLRGKVVLVDFWTYSCINCINTLPYVERWHEQYQSKGLVVVGVHTPEFPFERATENVEAAIRRFGIRYAVAQDNQYATWNAFDNQYWPAIYLIDKQGRIAYVHVGEGAYAQTEARIRSLLTEE
jgi:thiol-disulfide isomerase/thioredoxin